jgi:beta-N-acetylhexosaminidase
MINEIQSAAPRGMKFLVGVDQEGGRVARMREPLIVLPPARRFGERHNKEITERAGELVGRELTSLGFTVNFAPVLDVDTNPNSPVIGDRSFGATPERVIEHAISFARGLRQGGVWPCAKHFPGHGDAALDSHLSLPVVDHPRSRLMKVELAPFATFARLNLGAVMIAHVSYPALDPENFATTSRPIIMGELVERLGFCGPIFTDDIEMGAVERVGGAGSVAVGAVRAGSHGLLVCRSHKTRTAVLEALAREATRDSLFKEQLSRAAEQLNRLTKPTAVPENGNWIGSAEHLRLKEEILSALRSEDA